MAKLHPKMATHAKAIKAAHQELVKTRPGFKALPPHRQFREVQAHVRRTKA